MPPGIINYNMDWGNAIAGGAIGMIQSGVNNYFASQMASQARAENYTYNEKAAENADKRTRALYKDIYSPQALMNQYKAAGLSPSLMFGGTPGQGGVSGAQGSGTAGQPAIFSPMNLTEAAQAAALFAEAKKTNAEAEQVKPQAEADIAAKLAQAGHYAAAKSYTEEQTKTAQLENYLKEHTMDANINYIYAMADEMAAAAKKTFNEARSAKVLADVDEATYQVEVDKRLATLNNIISSTAKNNKEVEKIQQDMKYQIYNWDLEWRKLDVQEKQQTTYADWIDAQIPKIEKELELRAEELGIEKKSMWIRAVSEILKGVAIGAATVSQFGRGSNQTPQWAHPGYNGHKGMTADGWKQ